MSARSFDDDDRDAPQDIDLEWAEGGEEIRCAACGKFMHEDCEKCPHCGQWVLDESAAEERARGWYWPMVVAVLIAIILVIWAKMG
jgi:hypothetical protein